MTFYKTRACRQQNLLLPGRIDDYVAADNAARAIEAYVDMLDLAKLGFRHAARVVGAGQPPYDPSDLLKLYLYGYLNQIRSSRRLEREAGRNIELMWLLRGLKPGCGGCRLGWSGMIATVAGPLRHNPTVRGHASFAA